MASPLIVSPLTILRATPTAWAITRMLLTSAIALASQFSGANFKNQDDCLAINSGTVSNSSDPCQQYVTNHTLGHNFHRRHMLRRTRSIHWLRRRHSHNTVSNVLIESSTVTNSQNSIRIKT